MPVNKRHLWVALFCIAGFVINFFAFTPGFMSPDSFDQYAQSISHHYTDWHPPAMAFVWGLLNNIHQGPHVMLVLQLAFLWTACYHFSLVFDSKKWTAIILLVFLVSPVIQNFSGYIIKDTQMAFSWLLACAIMLRTAVAGKRMSQLQAIASLLLLIYGTWVRPNALPGLLPLIFWWVMIVFSNAGLVKRVGYSLLLTLLIAAGQMIFTKVLHADKLYAENKLYLHDLTGIYAKTGKDVYPQVLYTNPGFDTAYLRSKYHPATFDDIWWNGDGKTLLPDTSQLVTDAVAKGWKRAIKENPSVYLHNRRDGFLYYLHIKQRSDFYCNFYMEMYPDPKSLGYDLRPRYESFLYKAYKAMLQAQAKTFYMQAWFWMLTNLLLLCCIPLLKYTKLKNAFIVLVLSGILYKLPDFFVYQSDIDYRYFYWNSIACTIAVLLLFADRVLYKKKGSY